MPVAPAALALLALMNLHEPGHPRPRPLERDPSYRHKSQDRTIQQYHQQHWQSEGSSSQPPPRQEAAANRDFVDVYS